MRLIVASNNKGKIREIKEILAGFDLEVLSESEAGFNVDPEENGQTLADNALIKVNAIEVGEDMVLGDDTGLYVDYLGGPGVRSARYAGPGATDADNRKKMLEEMEGVEDRSGKFITVMALKYKGQVYQVQGECPGHISTEERGTHGFGYDQIFIPAGYDISFAEMEDEVKNSISHRRRALEKLAQILEKLLSA